MDYITQVQVRRFPSSLSRDYVALLEGAYGIERSIVTIVSFFFQSEIRKNSTIDQINRNFLCFPTNEKTVYDYILEFLLQNV